MKKSKPNSAESAIHCVTTFDKWVISLAGIVVAFSVVSKSSLGIATKLLLIAVLFAVFRQGMIAVELGIYPLRETSKRSFHRALVVSLFVTYVSVLLALLFLLRG